MNLHAYKSGSTTPLKAGDPITDFRGETAYFQAATRAGVPGKSATITASHKPGIDHFAPEFYASAFKLDVVCSA